MRSGEYNSIAIILALPLAIFLWQNSSCHGGNRNASHSNMNANNTSVAHQRDLRGHWGGDSISMEVTANGAEIEFDCAHGRITERIVPDDSGKFEVKGVLSPERGGPVRMGENNEQAALYRGSVTEDTMTLSATLTKNNESAGTFTLKRGEEARLRKCR